jgi:hypothetical protein
MCGDGKTINVILVCDTLIKEQMMPIVGDLAKIFCTLKFFFFVFFSTLAMKLKLGLQIGVKLLIKNY